MYYPYVRGRQYELLALRELVELGKLSEKIIPVIEPVKLSSALVKALETFCEKKRKVCIIYNPAVGAFGSDMNNQENQKIKEKFLKLIKDPNIIKTIISKEDIKIKINELEQLTGIDKESLFVVCTNRNELTFFSEVYKDATMPKCSLIPDERAFERVIRENRIRLEDRFNKKDRNADYAETVDEFFSDDHIFYLKDGFVGFSDFSVIGKDYLESGFAPYAVAIHIVYFDETANKALRIRHFVSKSNANFQNPAKKFYEALTELYNWVNENNIQPTPSLGVFLKHYEDQTYPGLGSTKKLSLMHHLELLGEHLDGRQK